MFGICFSGEISCVFEDFFAVNGLHSVHFLVYSGMKTPQYYNSRVKTTHLGSCKNGFEQLGLRKGTNLKYETALSTVLRSYTISGATSWTCISREWHSCWPTGPKLTPTRCNSSFPFPFSVWKILRNDHGKHPSLKFSLWTNSWDDKTRTVYVMTFYTSRNPLRLNCLFQNLDFLAAFVLLE